jgi:hypothetical protein
MGTPRSRKLATMACGAALTAALFGGGLVQPVAAQDDEIVHSAGGATLVVSPGNASAISAVAEAHASPGHAHTIGAAAEAIADCEDGALTRGAAALAVAHPDEGALTQSAAREMAATIRGEVEASLNGALTGGDDGDSPIRKVVENKCGKDDEPKKEKEAPPVVVEEPAPEPVVVVDVPSTGTGAAGLGLSAIFAAASGVAALGAVGVGRSRREDAALASIVRR